MHLKGFNINFTYAINRPEEEEPDAIFSEPFGRQARYKLDSRGQQEEGSHRDQVEIPGDRVTPKSVVDSGQVSCEKSKRDAELKCCRSFDI